MKLTTTLIATETTLVDKVRDPFTLTGSTFAIRQSNREQLAACLLLLFVLIKFPPLIGYMPIRVFPPFPFLLYNPVRNGSLTTGWGRKAHLNTERPATTTTTATYPRKQSQQLCERSVVSASISLDSAKWINLASNRNRRRVQPLGPICPDPNGEILLEETWGKPEKRNKKRSTRECRNP